MIKIRYSDLPTGLHVRTVVQGRHTILYLLPGLSTAERRAAVRRARSNARVGHGPRVPAAGVAFALGADRVRSTVRNGLSAARLHPAFFVPATIMVLAVAVAYLLLASVSSQLRAPQAGPARQLGVPLRTAPSDVRSGSPGQGSQAANPGVPGPGPGQRFGGAGHGGGQPAGPTSATHPSPFTSASSGPPGSGPSPTPSPGPSPSQTSSPSPSSFPAPTPSPLSTRPGLCVQVGPLGVCLKA